MKKVFSYFGSLNIIGKIMYLFLILLFVFLISRALSPAGKYGEFKQLIEKDSLFLSGYNQIYSLPGMRAEVKEKAYKEGLLKLASWDSIQLAVDLADSAVCLYINGIRIHRSKIHSLKQDKFLGSLPGIQIAGLFSNPQHITREYASIIKMPVVERQAPKDTLEAATNAWKPDTLIQKPAFLLLETEIGIDIILEQTEEKGMHDDWVRFLFHNKIFCRHTIESLGNFIMYRKQVYHPRVTVKIPARDLRAIYRALPEEAYVVLRLH